MKHIVEKLRAFFDLQRDRAVLLQYVAGDVDMAGPHALAFIRMARERESQEGKIALWRLVLEAEEALEAAAGAGTDDIAEILQHLLASYLLVDELRPSRFDSDVPSRPHLARLLVDAALGQLGKGNDDSAAVAFDRAAAYFSAEMPPPPELLVTDLAARILHEEQGNTFAAAIMLEDVDPLRKLGERRFTYDEREHERYVSSVESIADVFWRGGRFHAAARLIAPSLSYLHWRADKGHHFEFIVALNRFAKLALEDGDYVTAYRGYGELEKACEAGEEFLFVPFGRLGRAHALVGLRFYRGARRLFDEAIAALAHDDELRAEAIVGLSRLLLQAGDYDGAIRLHDEWRELTGDDAPEFLCEIEARRALAADDKAGALAWLEKSGEAPTGARGEQWGLHGALLAARIKADLERFGDADLDVSLALAIANSLRYSDRATLDALAAEIRLGIGRPDHASQLLNRALDVDQENIGKRLGIGSSEQRYLQLREMRQRVEQWLYLVFSTDMRCSYLRGYRAVILTKALGPYVARRTIQAAAEAAAGNVEVAAAVQALGVLRARLGALATSLLTDAPAAADALAETFVERERLEFEVSLATRALDLVDLVEHNDPFSVVLGVPEDAALVDYVRYSRGDGHGDERYGAFVVLGRRPDSGGFFDLGAAAEIDGLVRDFYALIQTGSTGDAFSRRFGRSPGEALRARLIDPLRTALSGFSQLFVSPDGLLTRLPFECLPVGLSDFLIDEFTIGYVSSSRSALYFHKQKPSRGGAPIVIGAPDYGAPGAASHARFQPLDGAMQEAVEVASLLGVAPVTGRAASKTILRSADPRILHVATHGYFLGDSRSRDILSKAPLLRSGLALAGANSGDGSGSGILTAEEVLSLDLRNTELVVLSACETGIGEYERGEALAGLARSFEAAGAWSIVSSLWKVPDDPTREMMVIFYRELALGARRPDALRKAKLATRSRHRDMLSWAGFIIQGYPGPLTSTYQQKGGAIQ